MKYIPGSIAFKPNQISMRLIPQLNSRLTYTLENIRPIRVKENDKDVQKLKYTFVEYQDIDNFNVKSPEDYHRVEVIFDNYAVGDAAINKILGVREEQSQDINEYDPNVNAVDRTEARRGLTEMINRSYRGKVG